MIEKLVPIKNWEDDFVISNLGYIKNIKTGTIRYGSPGKRGYWRMVLSSGKRKQSIRIHRLVAETFIPNPLNLPEVNHVKGNKSKNGENDLEWSSSSGNKVHGLSTGLYKANRDIKELEQLELKVILKKLKTLSKDSIRIISDTTTT
jgi:hypothetical protein